MRQVGATSWAIAVSISLHAISVAAQPPAGPAATDKRPCPSGFEFHPRTGTCLVRDAYALVDCMYAMTVDGSTVIRRFDQKLTEDAHREAGTGHVGVGADVALGPLLRRPSVRASFEAALAASREQA